MSIRTLGIYFLPVQTLNGDFTQMLLHTEVDQFVILDHPIIIVVIPEDIFDEVMNLCFHLMQHLYQKLPYFFLLEMLVSIGIESYDLLIDHLTH